MKNQETPTLKNKSASKSAIPPEVIEAVKTLENKGFEAFPVGGCVRDLLLGLSPKDWDITTNARPEEIIAAFPKTFYENDFGTVGVVFEQATDQTVKLIEVTPYRLEGKYEDYRHPSEVVFAKKIEDDLKRRDFTVNALAIRLSGDAIKDIIDLYGGFKDIKDKIIRTVGNPVDRFQEDALRMLRAVRLATQLRFTIDESTKMAIQNHADLLQHISRERIRDEFVKILMSDEPKKGIELAQELALLRHFIPELEESIGVKQNQAHAYEVWEHLLRSLQHAADKKWPLEIRLAALFHDISKPETKGFSRETQQITFYGHEVVGSRVTKKILERLKFPAKTIEKVVKLVRWHMFFADPEKLTLSAVRRMVVNVGRENIWDLMNVRVCDRIGTGRPKEEPYRLRKYQSMIEEALRDPVSVAMLKISGGEMIKKLGMKPGPRIGAILHALLEEVLEDPKLNTAEYLENRASELNKLSDSELEKLAKEGKKLKQEKNEAEVGEIRQKFHVK
ncbi:MAG: HD domain-containing protein [Patescibacteria group bacterium]|nr:HD domain-containing protein [Patescibacteria group bacterium]